MAKYSLIYIIYGNQIIDDYVICCIDRFKDNVNKVIIVSTEELKEQRILKLEKFSHEWLTYSEIAEMDLVNLLPAETDKVLFTHNLCYGPLFCLDNILLKMESYECWSLLENEKFFESALSCINKEYLSCLNYSCNKGFFFDNNLVSAFLCLVDDFDGTYDVKKHRSMDLIKRGIPFVYKNAFEENDFNITMGYQIQQTMEYIKESTTYDVGLIYENILHSYNMTSLYNRLHWNFILSDSKREVLSPDYKIAIVASLYYEKTIERNLNYLKNSPYYVDIYIILKNRDLVNIVEEYIKHNNLKWEIIIAKQNRGRDLSALLVEAKKIFYQCKYFCFLHDKQTTGGIGPDIVGDDFNDILFENLVCSEAYISELIDTFEQNKNLGILAPPEVCHGTYFSFLGKAWSNNYDNVINLADKLKLKVKIEYSHPPYILSTAFWCRTDALKKLFDYGWEYEDFPDEPLDLDGTLNHALERILMYVSQDAGYYAGIVSNTKFSNMYMTNLRILLDAALGVCHKNNLFSNYSELFSHRGRDLLEFCKMSTEIYIYGAGGNGSRIADFLNANGISFNGYIVSDNHKTREILNGVKIYELSEVINNQKDIKVIVSVNKKLQNVIIPLLKSKGVNNYFCVW